MAKDRPLHWIGGAALVVGVLVLGATIDRGAPQALALSLAHNTVSFAASKNEAIAMTSAPSATKVASRAVTPRKVAERIGALPSVPAGSMSIGVASLVSVLTPPSSGGNDLVRALRANARDLAAVVAPAKALREPLARVESSPPSDVLLAVRPSRGPPTS